jgi:hypothetical protein
MDKRDTFALLAICTGLTTAIVTIAAIIRLWLYISIGLAGVTGVMLLYGIIRLCLDIHTRHQARLLARQAQEHEQQMEREQLELDRHRFDLEQHLALTRIPYDKGIILHGLNPEQLYIPPIPQLRAPTRPEVPEETRQVQSAKPMLKLSQAVALPESDKLQVCYGTRDTGEPVIIDLQNSTHIEEAGVSGFGKSTLAKGILYQLTQRNTPEVLQLAFVDLEGETTAPFHSSPHVWQYVTRRNQHSAPEHRKAIITDVEDVESLIEALYAEIHRRDLTKRKKPFILAFFEEFEELKDALADLPKEQQARIYRKFKTVLRRGRKRGVLAFVVVQNSYTIEEIKQAQRQFQIKMTGAQKPSTAQAGGYQNLDLLKRLWSEKRFGQFLIECSLGEYIIQIPELDPHLRQMFDQAAGYEIESVPGTPKIVDATVPGTAEGHPIPGAFLEHAGDSQERPTALFSAVPHQDALPAQNHTIEPLDPMVIFTEEQRSKILDASKQGRSLRAIPEYAGIGKDRPRYQAMKLWLHMNGRHHTERQEAERDHSEMSRHNVQTLANDRNNHTVRESRLVDQTTHNYNAKQG